MIPYKHKIESEKLMPMFKRWNKFNLQSTTKSSNHNLYKQFHVIESSDSAVSEKFYNVIMQLLLSTKDTALVISSILFSHYTEI